MHKHILEKDFIKKKDVDHVHEGGELKSDQKKGEERKITKKGKRNRGGSDWGTC